MVWDWAGNRCPSLLLFFHAMAIVVATDVVRRRENVDYLLSTTITLVHKIYIYIEYALRWECMVHGLTRTTNSKLDFFRVFFVMSCSYVRSGSYAYVCIFCLFVCASPLLSQFLLFFPSHCFSLCRQSSHTLIWYIMQCILELCVFASTNNDVHQTMDNNAT